MKRTTIRSVQVIREPHEPPGGVVEHLLYNLDVFDANDNLIGVLGRVADLAVAQAAFDAAVAKYPDKRIFPRERARDPQQR